LLKKAATFFTRLTRRGSLIVTNIHSHATTGEAQVMRCDFPRESTAAAENIGL